MLSTGTVPSFGSPLEAAELESAQHHTVIRAELDPWVKSWPIELLGRKASGIFEVSESRGNKIITPASEFDWARCICPDASHECAGSKALHGGATEPLCNHIHVAHAHCCSHWRGYIQTVMSEERKQGDHAFTGPVLPVRWSPQVIHFYHQKMYL